MMHSFVPFSTLCILAVVVHYVSSDIEVNDKNNSLIITFTSDNLIGRSNVKSLQGLVVLADPPDACEPIKKVDFCCNVTHFSKIVLVDGSVSPNCTVKNKVENVANSSFDLVILYGKDIWKQDVKYPDDVYMNMTAVDLSHDDGEIIKKKYLYQNNSENYFYLKVTFGHSFLFYLACFIKLVLQCIFASVLLTIACFAVLITALLVFTGLLYIKEKLWSNFRNRRRYSNLENVTRFPADQSLPTEKYTKGAVCPVCKEKCIEGQKLLVFPFSQVYHTFCIVPWLTRNCRNHLLKNVVHFDEPSSESHDDLEKTSTTERARLVTSTNAGNTWGTFTGLNTNGRQSDRLGTRSSLAMNRADATRKVTDLSDSDNIVIIPSAARSINDPNGDKNDTQPKSI